MRVDSNCYDLHAYKESLIWKDHPFRTHPNGSDLHFILRNRIPLATMRRCNWDHYYPGILWVHALSFVSNRKILPSMQRPQPLSVAVLTASTPVQLLILPVKYKNLWTFALLVSFWHSIPAAYSTCTHLHAHIHMCVYVSKISLVWSRYPCSLVVWDVLPRILSECEWVVYVFFLTLNLIRS